MSRRRSRYEQRRKRIRGIVLFLLIGVLVCKGGSIFLSGETADQSNISLLGAVLEDDDDAAQDDSRKEKGEEAVSGGLPWLLERFLESTLPTGEGMALAYTETEEEESVVSSQVQEQEPAQEQTDPSVQQPAEPTTAAADAASGVISSAVPKGAVLIYHTHSTESYEPYSEGNYHVTQEEGTVRDVGSVLENALKEKGITVYHDKTLHDSPSYNNSYSRSLETLKRQLDARPEISVVIDLHRDAATSGKKYSTVNIEGKTASSFNIVVGNKNENYTQLLAFANQFLETANSLYPGLGGRVIEREYKFNGYLSNHYLLLEVGNNENTIEEVRTTGEALADVLESVMKTF